MMIDFNQLWPKWDVKPYGVLHLGAHYGEEADTYQALGVSNVIWIEANPAAYAQLQQHISRFANNRTVQACVGEEQGKQVKFNVSNNSQSSSYLELGHHKEIHPEVHYVSSFEATIHRVDHLLGDADFGNGRWFLNMDLQGTELPAIRGMRYLLKYFDWVYSEINTKEVYKNCTIVNDLDAYLAKWSFYRAETGALVADSWSDALYIKSNKGSLSVPQNI